MSDLVAFISTFVLTFFTNWLLRKYLGRYASYLLANAVSISASPAIAFLIARIGGESAPLSTIYFRSMPVQLIILLSGLVWLRLNSFKFAGAVLQPAMVSSRLPSGRVEPVFGALPRSIQSGGMPERTGRPHLEEQVNALYEDPSLDISDGNFFIRYWRGGYSLPFSYWIVGILSGIVCAAIAIALSVLFASPDGYEPLRFFCFTISVWAFFTLLTFWNTVGLWRSASRYMVERWKHGRGTFWGGLVKFLVVVGMLFNVAYLFMTGVPQIVESYNMAFRGDPDLPDYSLRLMRGGTEMEIVGGFKYGLANDLERLLKAAPQVDVVHLDSPGGRIGEAKKVHDLIRQRRLITYVANECFSACTLAFAAGRERWLGGSGKLGFHAPSFPGMSEQKMASSAAEQQMMFIRDGFNPYFVARALSTPASSLWTPTAQELSAAGTIDNVASPDKFAISGLGANFSADDAAGVVNAMLPAVAVLAARDPDTARAIYRTFHQLYINGGTTAEAVSKLRRLVDVEAAKYLPLADDETMLEIGRLAGEEYHQLYKLDSAICYKFIAGEDVDVSQYLTPELIGRESDLQEKIIRTAAERPAPSAAELQAGWQRVAAIVKTLPEGRSIALFNTKPRPDQYGEFCALYAATYDAILRQKPETAAVLIRELMSDKQ